MPISRAAFEVKMPGDPEVVTEDLPQTLDDAGLPAPQTTERGDNEADVPAESEAPGRLRTRDYQGARESSKEIHRDKFLRLPSADVTSAGPQDDIGSTRPQKEAPRS